MLQHKSSSEQKQGNCRKITAMLKARKSLIPTENNVPAQSVTAMVSLS